MTQRWLSSCLPSPSALPSPTFSTTTDPVRELFGQAPHPCVCSGWAESRAKLSLIQVIEGGCTPYVGESFLMGGAWFQSSLEEQRPRQFLGPAAMKMGVGNSGNWSVPCQP